MIYNLYNEFQLINPCIADRLNMQKMWTLVDRKANNMVD